MYSAFPVFLENLPLSRFILIIFRFYGLGLWSQRHPTSKKTIKFVEVDKWWGDLLQRKDYGGQLSVTLVTTLLILPYDQASVERLFSLCAKNNTK